MIIKPGQLVKLDVQKFFKADLINHQDTDLARSIAKPPWSFVLGLVLHRNAYGMCEVYWLDERLRTLHWTSAANSWAEGRYVSKVWFGEHELPLLDCSFLVPIVRQ